MPPVAAHPPAPTEYLALGDSYSIGEGVRDDQRWPVQLAAAMRARGIAIAHPHLIAKTGWTTDELSAAIDQEQKHGQLRKHYGLVSLLIGVNDQYRGSTAAEYAKKFSRLLDRAIALAAGDPKHVLVVSIPDWGATPFARASGRDRAQIAREIDQFNAVDASACHQRGVTWIDITDLTRAPKSAHLLVADGLHPSQEMYALWVARIQKALPK